MFRVLILAFRLSRGFCALIGQSHLCVVIRIKNERRFPCAPEIRARNGRWGAHERTHKRRRCPIVANSQWHASRNRPLVGRAANASARCASQAHKKDLRCGHSRTQHHKHHLNMAPLKTRAGVYATPSHMKRLSKATHTSVTTSNTKTAVKSRVCERDNTVGVYVRLRPLKLDEPTLIKIDENQIQTVPPDGSSPQIYKFTKVFENAPQVEIFDKVARPVAEAFIRSAKDGLIFTYGITGSGKTYTMEGLKTDPGLIYRTIDFLFNSFGDRQTKRSTIETDGHNAYTIQSIDQLYPTLGRPETPQAIPSVIKWQNRTKDSSKVDVDDSYNYCLFMSLIELYNKQVHDLFEDFDTGIDKEKKRREIRSDQRGMSYVANAVEIEVKSADEAVEYYTRGIRRRKTTSTALNTESSRGHCVLNLKLVRVKRNYDDAYDDDSLAANQLCLVDLAGSERSKRSGATGGALHEAGNINNSLGALRKCIRSLRDREPTNIQYREYSLTRLFKSYFEGHGAVNMVLCVKPTAEDFYENNIAMEFGLLTQDVAVDYAPPPKVLKRSKSRAQDLIDTKTMYDLFCKESNMPEPDPNADDEQYFSACKHNLKIRCDRQKKYFETWLAAQAEVRQNILKLENENALLRQQNQTLAKESRSREEILENKLESTERARAETVESLTRMVKDLKQKNNEQSRHITKLHNVTDNLAQENLRHAQNVKLLRDIYYLIKSEEDRSDSRRRIMQLLKKMDSNDFSRLKPSAPQMDPMQTSSPMDSANPSTESSTPPPTTATTTGTTGSDEAMDYQNDIDHANLSQTKHLTSPSSGVPIINPRHNRSLSCSNMQWIHHKPSGTIDTGTVMKPKFKNGKAVKTLRSSDILRKDAAGYSVVHQDADANGEVETSIYKGHIISTVCGGAQVILDDVETMRQVSPKRRKRAASDAHYTH